MLVYPLLKGFILNASSIKHHITVTPHATVSTSINLLCYQYPFISHKWLSHRVVDSRLLECYGIWYVCVCVCV